MISQRHKKLLTLAFDTRTTESEAIVAFLLARKSISAGELLNQHAGTLTSIMVVYSIPHNIFAWAFDEVYHKAGACNITNFQARLKLAKAVPKSALFGDLEVRCLPQDKDVFHGCLQVIHDYANKLHDERRSKFR